MKDLITNCFPKTYPSGMDSEIIKTLTLKNYIKLFNKKNYNEHLTSYFYEYNKNFKILNIESNESHSLVNENLSIDTLEDFNKMNFLIEYLDLHDIKDCSISRKIKILKQYK